MAATLALHQEAFRFLEGQMVQSFIQVAPIGGLPPSRNHFQNILELWPWCSADVG
jgi:hypothetical protein